MQIARIVDLLDPFLRVPIASPGIAPQLDSRPTKLSTPRDSETANAGEACPERSRKPALSLPKGEPAVLSPAQLQDISTYIDILVRWNARINLTAIRDPEDIVTRHFGESLFAARHLFPAPSSVSSSVSSVVKDLEFAGTLADVGSGAGFPGLPIKLWASHLSLTLIESNHKKAAFLREVTRSLTLTDVNIQNTRAESVPGPFDVVTLRAVEHFAAILPTAAALVAPSGRLALLISTAQQPQAHETLPHFSWSNPTPIPRSRSRILLVARRSS
jgi:16S rRNA (guanine527-N7)-methyltransferase